MDNEFRLFSQNNAFYLLKLDDRKIEESSCEIRVFIVVKNELSGLPYLFSYYRKMGVGCFFFVDDRSEDGTRTHKIRMFFRHRILLATQTAKMPG